MKRFDEDDLPFLKPRPPSSIEPRFLGWLLSGLLVAVGIGLFGCELLSPDDLRWGILSAGISYIALAIVICPRSQSPFWVRFLASVIAGVFIL